MNILGVDIGGTNLKFRTQQQEEITKVPSGPKMTPEVMMKAIKAHTAGWRYDHVSIGFPGPVIHDRPLLEPHNLGTGWVRFDFNPGACQQECKRVAHRLVIVDDVHGCFLRQHP